MTVTSFPFASLLGTLLPSFPGSPADTCNVKLTGMVDLSAGSFNGGHNFTL